MDKIAAPLTDALKDILTDDLAWSIRFLRQLAALPPAQRPAYADTQLAAANPPRLEYTANLLEQIRAAPDLVTTLLAGAPVPSLFQDLGIRLAPLRSAVDEYQAARPKLMEVLNQLRTRYTVILSGKEYPAALPAFADVVAAQLTRFAPADERQELPNLLADALAQIGYGFVRQQAHAPAVEAFLAALRHCETHGLTEKADFCRLRLAKLYKDGSRDIDLALRNILPLVGLAPAPAPANSLQQVELVLIAASVYEQAGDTYEARRYLRRAEVSLRALNLDFTPPEPFAAALLRWCPHLFPLPGIERLRHFKEGIAQWMQVAQLRQKLSADKSPTKHWEQVFLDIFDLDKAVRALEVARSAADQQLLKEQGYLDWASPAEDADAADKEAALSFYRAANAISDRIEGGDYSSETEKSIHDLLQSPFCRAYPDLEMTLYWQLGELLEERGQADEARASYQKAFVLAAVNDDLGNLLHSLLLMLVTYPEEAHNERIGLALLGIEYIEEARQRVTTPYQRGSFLRGKEQFYALALREAWETDQLALLLRVGELVKGKIQAPRNLSAASRQVARDYLAAWQKQAATTTPTQERLAEKQLMIDRLFLTEEEGARPQVQGKVILEQGEENDDGLTPWQAALIAELKLYLEPGSACISYYQLAPDQFLIFAHNHLGDYTVVRDGLPDGRLASLLAAVSAGITFPGGYRGRGMEPYQGASRGRSSSVSGLDAALGELAGFLIPDEVCAVLAGCDRLYLCPHRALHALPFHVLPYDGEFLIERFAISYVPSLNLLFREQPAPPSGVGEVVLVGTTSFPGRHLADLPGAAAEARTIAGQYRGTNRPVKVFLEHDATREQLLRAEAEGALAGAEIIHLALHGEAVEGDNPMNARLFLHTGYLDGFDLSLWQLRAELVILSACYAGLRPVAGREQAFFPGDDLFGFQAAFFTAGAKRLLGALWPVDDAIGKELMCSFHRRAGTGDYARAWQQTVLEFLAEASPRHRNIVYWAAFFLVEGRR